jgi:guanine deaminase
MAHCVHSGDEEIALMRENGVWVAHCPQSNTNLSSGIAPVRKFLDAGLRVGLGSDVAGGSDSSILRVMRSAVEVSKLRSLQSGDHERPLSTAEAFYLGTAGGGSFFGRVGGFAPGFEFDALVVDDGSLRAPFGLTVVERVARAVSYADDRCIVAKYARGSLVGL